MSKNDVNIYKQETSHSRPQRPRSFWSAPRIAASGQVQHRKSAIHRLPVTLHMLRVKSDKYDWFCSQSIVFTKPFKTVKSLETSLYQLRLKLQNTFCFFKTCWQLMGYQGCMMPINHQAGYKVLENNA